MLRQSEIKQAIAALLERQSLLVLGDEGSGKTQIANAVSEAMIAKGFLVAIAGYGGSAKRTFTEIADQLGVSTTRSNSAGREIALTADELRDAIAPVLTGEKATADGITGILAQPILICDDAHRYPQSMRFWLQDAIGNGAVLLLLATKPPRKDIFLKMPRIALQALQVEEVRSLMLAEAMVLGVTVDNAKLAELQERSGGNPYLAKRVMREEILGIGEGLEGDHVEYIDGTPFLIAILSMIGIIRFVGLGLGDRSLYIIGGVSTILAISLRVVLMRANSRNSRL
jgi:energy-coupling factor transporter ATP-binding protein EcfA2